MQRIQLAYLFKTRSHFTRTTLPRAFDLFDLVPALLGLLYVLLVFDPYGTWNIIKEVGDYGVNLFIVIRAGPGVLILPLPFYLWVSDELLEQDTDNMWRHHVFVLQVLIHSSWGLSGQNYALGDNKSIGVKGTNQENVCALLFFFLLQGLTDLLCQSGRTNN